MKRRSLNIQKKQHTYQSQLITYISLPNIYNTWKNHTMKDHIMEQLIMNVNIVEQYFGMKELNLIMEL